MTTNRHLETLVQAAHLTTSGKSRSHTHAGCVLDGVPVGGWPETTSAIRQLTDLLPGRWARSYTVDQYIDAMYGAAGSGSGRYYRRSAEDALSRAARIEASKA